MDPGSNDCQLGAGARMGAGPSRLASSGSAVGDADDEELPLEWLALPGRLDMTSPPVVLFSWGALPCERPPEPSNDDDAAAPPMENRPDGSISEAAAVPVAPTTHRHPKMRALAFIGKPQNPGQYGGRPIVAEISQGRQCGS